MGLWRLPILNSYFPSLAASGEHALERDGDDSYTEFIDLPHHEDLLNIPSTPRFNLSHNCRFIIDWLVTSSLQSRPSGLWVAREAQELAQRANWTCGMVANIRNFFGSALRSLWKVEWGPVVVVVMDMWGLVLGGNGGGGRLQRQFPFCSHWHDCLPPLAFMEVLNWDHLYIKIGTEKELLRLVRGKRGIKRLVICDKGSH